MAKLINVSASTEERMTPGERRVAARLESFLNEDCLVWYDIPVGRKTDIQTLSLLILRMA